MSTFKRKKKLCISCQEEKWIYARKMCQYCYAKTKSYSTFKTKKKPQKEAYGYKNQKELFLDLWHSLSDKTCPISNEDLSFMDGWNNSDSDFKQSQFYSMFIHVLSKGKYAKFKLYPKNIIIAHPEVHYLYDFGTKKQRLESGWNFNILYKKKQQLLDEYNICERY